VIGRLLRTPVVGLWTLIGRASCKLIFMGSKLVTLSFQNRFYNCFPASTSALCLFVYDVCPSACIGYSIPGLYFFTARNRPLKARNQRLVRLLMKMIGSAAPRLVGRVLSFTSTQ